MKTNGDNRQIDHALAATGGQVWAQPAAAPEARIVEGSPSLFQGLKRLRPS